MNFKSIIGNNEVKEYLLNAIKNNEVSQSYLFSGTEGIGKMLIAKQFTKHILCENNEKSDSCECKSCKCFDGNNHSDFVIINEDGESIKIEQIRNITNRIIEQPIISNKKVYIINDCEKMTVEAQNCLLKTLEEPPEFAVLILITSNENIILNTIKSRCMIIKFNDISNDELKKYAIENLNYTEITDNFLKSFNGSIGQAIMQKENFEKFVKIESIINELETQDMINVMNVFKIIYDKDDIYKILEYMIICVYERSKINGSYLNCVEIINKAILRLKSNCNFDMTIDTMIFDMFECVKKGI